MNNVYYFSSCFNHQNLILQHKCSFSAFPSLWAEDLGVNLPSCFPSMIMCELCLIKNKVQITLNTQSKNSRQCITVSCDDISSFAWNWMIKDALEGLVQSNTFGVIKSHFVEKDEMVVQQWRDTQQFFCHKWI